MKLALTGHRPQRLKGKEAEIEQWIYEKLTKYDTPEEVLTVYSGMAQGADQIFARAAINYGAITICCFPYYKKRFYPAEKHIMEHSDEILYISEEYTGNEVYYIRDKYMVDNCDVLLAVWDGVEKGGTWLAVKYAQKIGKPIVFYDFDKEGNEDVN